MSDAWRDRLDRTFLASERACRALDQKMAELLAVHHGIPRREATPKRVLTLRLEPTARFLREAGPTPSNAIYCATTLCLLGELMLCAERGGILRSDVVDRFAGGDHDRRINAEALRLLRNALCHPAAACRDEGVDTLIAILDYLDANFDEAWVADVRRNHSAIAGRPVALFALRLVDNVGYWQAGHWGIAGKLPRRRGYPSRR